MKAIFIDIDIPYEYMKRYRLDKVLELKIHLCLNQFGLTLEKYRIDRSQCGNTHLRVIIKENIDPVTIIRFKYCVGEDHKRLTHTIRRYEKTGKILDFFWLSKNKKCVES